MKNHAQNDDFEAFFHPNPSQASACRPPRSDSADPIVALLDAWRDCRLAKLELERRGAILARRMADVVRMPGGLRQLGECLGNFFCARG